MARERSFFATLLLLGVTQGASYPLIRVAVRDLSPAVLMDLRVLFALPVLIGYFPETMKTPVWGKVNWAYLFALSQFIMTWVICAMYVRVAKGWDRKNAALLAKFPQR